MAVRVPDQHIQDRYAAHVRGNSTDSAPHLASFKVDLFNMVFGDRNRMSREELIRVIDSMVRHGLIDIYTAAHLMADHEAIFKFAHRNKKTN